MERYPQVKEALPVTCTTKSRTAMLLTPAVVTGTLGALTIASITGIAVASTSFSTDAVKANSVGAAQVLLLLACFFSILYVGLHIQAAIDNEPVGVIRPPVIRIHGMCFIAARVAALFWIIAMIASCAVIAKPSVCVVANRSCRLQAVSVFISIFALLIIGIVLTSLESCQQPFEVPLFLQRRIKRKASVIADDIEAYQRSVSQTSLYHDEQGDMTEKPRELKESAKHEPPNPTNVSGEWPERRMTPLLPSLPTSARSRGWGDEWTHPTMEKKLAIKHSDSAISVSMSDSSYGSPQSSSAYGRSSSGYARSSTVSGYVSNSDRESTPRRTASQRPYPQRSVTSSSSISNFSRRSPLSTMRSADRPEIAIRPSLRYTPPIMPPPHEWNYSRTATISQLLPVADTHRLQRRSSQIDRPVDLLGPVKELPPIPGAPPSRTRRSIVRSSKRMQRNDLNSYHERELEDHLRKIETSIARRRSQHQLARSAFARSHLERTQLEGPQTPVTVRAKYLNDPIPHLRAEAIVLQRESFVQPPALSKPLPIHSVRRSHTSAGELYHEPKEFGDTVKINFEKIQPLRRLSLGNLPIGLDWGTWEI